MPGLLDFLGLGSAPVSQEDKAAIARARKTVAYAKKNAPDEGVRILNRIVLDMKELASTLPSEAAEVQKEAEAAIAEFVVDARKEIEDDCKAGKEAWLDFMSPAKDDPASKKTRAEGLLHYMNHTTEVVVRDRDMLSRLSAFTKDRSLEQLAKPLFELEENVKAARRMWLELVPQRTTRGPPTAAPAVSRPKPEGVKNPKGWSDACDRIDTANAKGEAPAPDDLAMMAKGAQEALTADKRWDWEKDLKTTLGCSWEQVKSEFKKIKKTDAAKATDFMSGYWWFRKLTVDAEMKKLADRYTFQWESVGSTNLESDYDISVRSHGTDGKKPYLDWQIVQDFNKTLSARFNGVQPGTLFDTNLYASAEPPALKDPKDKTETEKDMDAMAEAGQDVGALMKMRRYMGWEDYVDYQDAALAEIEKAVASEKDEGRKKLLHKRLVAARRQFETADALYFKKLTTILDQTAKNLPRSPEGEKVKKEIEAAKKGADSPEGQKKLIEMVEKIEKNPDQLMAATNAAYVEAMEEVRTIEAELAEVDKKIEALKGKGDPTSLQQGTSLQEQRAAIMARLETLQADAVFFAAEAYHSKGPFQHIVQASQKSAQEAKAKGKPQEFPALVAEKLNKLPITSFMQSFNEQLGDFLKDLKHYDEKSPFPGLGLYRSSKYLERLCEAMDWIGRKLESDKALAEAFVEYRKILLNGKTPAVVKGELKGLVDLRGGKVELNGAEDPQQEMEAWALTEVHKIFGSSVSTLSELGTLVKDLGKRVNVVLRKADVAQKMMAESEKAYFPK